MSNVAIQKVNGSKANLPIFDEITKKFEEVRNRAFEIFERRSRQMSLGLEDWLKAEREILGAAAAELTEKSDAYQLQMSLPGFDPKDVNITATPEEIIVRGESKKEKKSNDGKVLWTEFSTNDVCRHFQLPNTIDADKVTATLDKGLLRISAPKVAQEPGKTASAAA